jgi:hypothetical protein
VHFLDGEQLDALNKWATLGTDANARARLLGLRLSLRATIRLLQGHEVSGISLQPTFRQGIELYLSEPVNSDDQLIQSLMSLLQRLKNPRTAEHGSLEISGEQERRDAEFYGEEVTVPQG